MISLKGFEYVEHHSCIPKIKQCQCISETAEMVYIFNTTYMKYLRNITRWGSDPFSSFFIILARLSSFPPASLFNNYFIVEQKRQNGPNLIHLTSDLSKIISGIHLRAFSFVKYDVYKIYNSFFMIQFEYYDCLWLIRVLAKEFVHSQILSKWIFRLDILSVFGYGHPINGNY